jgi:hypothetical protein
MGPVEAPQLVQIREALPERWHFAFLERDARVAAPRAQLGDRFVQPAAFETIVVHRLAAGVIADAAGVQAREHHAVGWQYDIDEAADIHVSPIDETCSKGAAFDRLARLPASEEDAHREYGSRPNRLARERHANRLGPDSDSEDHQRRIRGKQEAEIFPLLSPIRFVKQIR